jgi:hypothetical protein
MPYQGIQIKLQAGASVEIVSSCHSCKVCEGDSVIKLQAGARGIKTYQSSLPWLVNAMKLRAVACAIIL